MDTETKNEFSAVKKQFNVIDKRFEQVDKRFEQINKRFEKVDERFEQVDKRFDKIDQRLDYADFDRKGIRDEMKKGFSSMNNKMDRLYDRIDGFLKLHLKVDLETVALRATCDRLDGRITALESK